MLTKLGRYEILERIGQGAMADVYRAFDPSINRTLAIKVLKAEFQQNPEYAARFLREAKAAGSLSHPNIVTIYDVGEERGHPYIVMEILGGESLEGLTQRGVRLEAKEVARIGLQLAEALSYAHAAGIVHRDIKPSNIVLALDGSSIKLLDFGIACLAEAEDIGVEDAALRTQVGQVLGTPRYMSPEQALGQATDGRTDLFSVGVVLYELVTGRRAFSSGNPAALALQITHSDPEPIATFAPDCPGGLQFIINKLLSKRPERRFADGAQLAEALRREVGSEAQINTVRRALPLPVRMTLIMGSITALVLFACIGAVLQRQDQAMERMALSSGAAITSFIASNVALTAVDNAALPAPQRDWAPVEAFVRTTSADPNIRQITVVDEGGVVRASTNAGQIGKRYPRVLGGRPLSLSGAMVTESRGEDGAEAFRFVRPITYAGRVFGQVAVDVNKADLNAASSLSRLLLGFLAVVTLGAVLAVSYAAARAVAAPVRQLKAAMADATRGDLDFRISHGRRDEFGDLFDGFNRLADALQPRLDVAGTFGSSSGAISLRTDPLEPLAPTSAAEIGGGVVAPGTISADAGDLTQIAAFGLPLPAAHSAADEQTQIGSVVGAGPPEAGRPLSGQQLGALAMIRRFRDIGRGAAVRS